MRLRALSTALLLLSLWPSLTGTQASEQVRRIGYLSHGSSPALDALQHGLRTLGWVEGRNIAVDYRFTGGRDDQIPKLAADLVQHKVELIVVAASNYADAVMRATRTIPIVFCSHGDPVGAGHVASLSRPGRNVTGISNLLTELSAKQLELLHAAVPGKGPIAVLWNPAAPPHGAALASVRDSARNLGIEISFVPAKEVEEFVQAFREMHAERARAVLVLASPVYYVHHARLADLASEHRLPAVLGWSEFPKAGGLMSYGPNLNDMFRRCAGLVDKVLRGSKPADTPVEQAPTYHLVINLKAARQLGLSLPATILAGADEVIEDDAAPRPGP